MNLDTVFPVSMPLSDSEQHELIAALSVPSVQKFLKMQQREAFRGIANGEPREGESDASYLRRQAKVNGAISVLEDLLKIGNTK